MTSPTDPLKPSLRERISERLPGRGSDRATDPEERFQRNVIIGFVALIVIAAIVVIVGLGYGWYDDNLRPLASVDGTSIDRGQWQDRQRLETFRLQRAESQVRAGLADGSIDADVADRLLSVISSEAAAIGVGSMERLVDLIYQEQLAAEEGVSLGEDELAAALAADGTSEELRRISMLVIQSPEESAGLPATSAGRAAAHADAEAALAALEAGTPIAEVAAEYSPPTASSDGDIGYVRQSDITDPVWAETLFTAEEGAVTPIIEGEAGELLIGQVTDIVAARPDPGFLAAVRDEVGEAVHTRQVELEALSEKLQEHIIAEADATEYDQVRLAEILIEGDTFGDPEQDEGSIRASHILYAPGPLDGEPVPEDDPGWDEAEALAQEAADQLRAVDDPERRAWAFAQRAQRDSDGPTGVNGGDLGYFDRASMVPEFADPLFDDPDLRPGDIVGPVRSEFGWHVIQFTDRKAPLAERLAAVQAALAEDGAVFADVAAEYSDGVEAYRGGETGWTILDDLDELSAIAIAAVEIGGITEPIEGDRGWYIYQKLDEGRRPPDPDVAMRRAETVFSDWYDERRFEAEDEGRISIDEAVYADDAAAALGLGG